MRYVFSTLARKQYEQKANWYLRFRGKDFERSFTKNLFSAIDAIAQMPTIGRIERQGKGSTFRSFLAHPGCRIFYVHTPTLVRIQRLHFSAMETPQAPLKLN